MRLPFLALAGLLLLATPQDATASAPPAPSWLDGPQDHAPTHSSRLSLEQPEDGQVLLAQLDGAALVGNGGIAPGSSIPVTIVATPAPQAVPATSLVASGQVIDLVWKYALIPLIAWGFKVGRDYAQAHVKSKLGADVLVKLDNFMETAVRSMGQTYVDDLKDKNAFTKSAQVHAGGAVLAQVKTNLGPQGLALLAGEVSGNVDDFLRNKLEATVHAVAAADAAPATTVVNTAPTAA